VKAPGHRDLVTVVGSSPTVCAGEWLTAEGTWVRDKEHGLQLKATVLRTVPPTTTEGIERYLGSGMVKGIGPVFAKRMVGRFGADNRASSSLRAVTSRTMLSTSSPWGDWMMELETSIQIVRPSHSSMDRSILEAISRWRTRLRYGFGRTYSRLGESAKKSDAAVFFQVNWSAAQSPGRSGARGAGSAVFGAVIGSVCSGGSPGGLQALAEGDLTERARQRASQIAWDVLHLPSSAARHEFLVKLRREWEATP
jgi:hypothetical protein